jgi:hypothetical protein
LNSIGLHHLCDRLEGQSVVPTTKHDPPPSSVVVKRGAIDMRVDSAHPLREPPSGEAEIGSQPLPLAAQLPADSPAATLAQVQLQAEQLSVHLTARHDELERRESELQESWAALEAASREARLLIEEREAEVLRREECLQVREQQLVERELSLAQRTAQVDAISARCEQQHADTAAVIKSAEADQRWQAEQRHWELQRQSETAELARERRMLERRGQLLDSRRTALEQLRAELMRRQRETLEVRLATEELWAQMSHEVSAADLAQSLHRLRNQVADHYRLASAELAERQQTLERLRLQIAGQQERLSSERQQVIEWAARRQQELDARSIAITARSSAVSHSQ